MYNHGREDGIEAPKRGYSILDDWNPHRVSDEEWRAAEALEKQAAAMTAAQKRAAALARMPKPAFVATRPLHCVACGVAIAHNGETAEQWAKIRRCGDCRSAGRVANDMRHCRICGTPHTMQSANSHKAGWSTWATCTSCKEGGVS